MVLKDKALALSNNKLKKGVISLAELFPAVAAEWDFAKNDLTPQDVGAYSKKRVWWIGPCGHSYDALIYNRTHGNSGCPYCSGNKVLKGFNDLESLFPDVAAEWAYDLNDGLSPDQVTAGADKKVFWRCKYGHVWSAYIKSRTKGHNCPVCKKQQAEKGVNDLMTLFPDIASDWDSAHNNETPDKVYAFTKKLAQWKCAKGHCWTDTVKGRTQNKRDCPYCSGTLPLPGEDLESLYPQLAAEWDYERNRGLLPSQVFAESSKVVSWRCKRNHTWKSKISDRIKGCNCPYCSQSRFLQGVTDLQTLFPDIAKEWCQDINGAQTPNDVFAFSSNIATWRCEKGHIWDMSIKSRTRNRKNCPYCAIAGKSLADLRPDIASEWDYEKNDRLTPDMVTLGSHTKVWLRCQEKHSWHTPVKDRVSGADCPYCSGRLPIQGKTDLFSQRPDIAADWAFDLNVLKPWEVTVSSNQKAWWRCKLGHEWESVVYARTAGSNCPVCSAHSRNGCIGGE